MEAVYCQLHSGSGLHSPIELPHNVKVAIGRGPKTKISSTKCSRKQVELIANYDSKQVTITISGKNPSFVSNTKLKKGSTHKLGCGGTFELIDGHRYHIFFGTTVPECSSLSDNGSGEIEPVKRMKMDDSSESERKVECYQTDSLIICKYGPQCASDKIAGFDLDGTIIETASGRKFATSYTDWKLLPHVNSKLRELHRAGYKIVIFSNQGGIRRGKPTKEEFMKKLVSISKTLKVPLLVYAAIDDDIYRKPCMGMWRHLLKIENSEVVPSLTSCFYVGDAAGRFADWRKGAKKDFSCTDRKFACNIGVNFETPEEFFLGFQKCTKFSFGDFDPRATVLSEYRPKIHPAGAVLIHHDSEVVVFVGFPASGKSTFYEKIMKPNGYVHVNRDKLGSWQKCVNSCEQELKRKRKVVIDNTNPDVESRLRYITCAKACGVPVRCFQFMTTLAESKHNNKFRELTTKTSLNKVTDIAYNTYKSKFVQPSVSEGFSEVLQITINASVDDEYADLYMKFLL